MAAGGTDDPSNIQLLCANCHEDKTRTEDTRYMIPFEPRGERKVRQIMARVFLEKLEQFTFEVGSDSSVFEVDIQ
jgi:hypothetical protein